MGAILKEEKKALYLEVVKYIRKNKVSMMRACHVKKVAYTPFFYWVKKQGCLKDELINIKEMEDLKVKKEAVKLIHKNKYNIEAASRKVGISPKSLTRYIEGLSEVEKQKVTVNAGISDNYTLLRDSKNRAYFKKAIQKMLDNTKNNTIYADEMLDILISCNIQIPRQYFTRELTKKGIQVID